MLGSNVSHAQRRPAVSRLQLRRPAPRENEGDPTPRASPACGKECGKENGQAKVDARKRSHVSRPDQAGSKKQQPITRFLQTVTNTGKTTASTGVTNTGKKTASTGKRKPAGPESQAPCAKKSRKGKIKQ